MLYIASTLYPPPSTPLDAKILTTVVTRYFDAVHYKKEGYQQPIAISHDATYPIYNLTMYIENKVSKSEVKFYDNSFFDTSAFTF